MDLFQAFIIVTGVICVISIAIFSNFLAKKIHKLEEKKANHIFAEFLFYVSNENLFTIAYRNIINIIIISYILNLAEFLKYKDLVKLFVEYSLVFNFDIDWPYINIGYSLDPQGFIGIVLITIFLLNLPKMILPLLFEERLLEIRIGAVIFQSVLTFGVSLIGEVVLFFFSRVIYFVLPKIEKNNHIFLCRPLIIGDIYRFYLNINILLVILFPIYFYIIYKQISFNSLFMFIVDINNQILGFNGNTWSNFVLPSIIFYVITYRILIISNRREKNILKLVSFQTIFTFGLNLVGESLIYVYIKGFRIDYGYKYLMKWLPFEQNQEIKSQNPDKFEQNQEIKSQNPDNLKVFSINDFVFPEEFQTYNDETKQKMCETALCLYDVAVLKIEKLKINIGKVKEPQDYLIRVCDLMKNNEDLESLKNRAFKERNKLEKNN